jgi:adenosine kinase
MSILCTGSVAYDYLMTFPGYFKDHILPDKLESISLSFLVDHMVRQRGGTAPNIAYTLALLGDKPSLLATVGEDFEEYRMWLESKGIDTSMVIVIHGKYTASFFANTDKSNAQIASFYTGAMADAGQLSIINSIDSKPVLVVISPNDPGAMARYAQECHEMHIPYLFDPGQQVVRNDPKDLRFGVEHAQSLFVNEYEFELLQKHTGMSSSEILQCVDFMVVTCGEKGSIIFVNGKQYDIPTVQPMEILDPTGVGDAFRGGFLRGWQLNLDWQTCGQMGALAATYCLEQRGTQNHSYSITEFISRYRKYFEDKGVLDTLLQNN